MGSRMTDEPEEEEEEEEEAPSTRKKKKKAKYDKAMELESMEL